MDLGAILALKQHGKRLVFYFGAGKKNKKNKKK